MSMKNFFKRIVLGFLILVSTASCAKTIEGVNSNKNYDPSSILVIDFDVKLFNDESSDKEIQKLNFFDPLVVLAQSANRKGRVKVKLQSGVEGWVEEKYTSKIPNDWIKKKFNENYYCYISPDQIMNPNIIKKDNIWVRTELSNLDYTIYLGMITAISYVNSIDNNNERINNRIAAGDEKKLNWSKAFIYGDYKINYTITTDDPERWIIESFDFIKIDKSKISEYYYFNTTYKRSEAPDKRLNQRKILFSALQSLR